MTPARPDYLVGIDGGGTGCRVAITRVDGDRIAEVSGGPANVTSDFDTALRNILSAIDTARAQAGLTVAQIRPAFAHAGLAGVMSAQDEVSVARHLPFERCTVSDDRLTSVIGALDARNGVLVSVGTGSFVACKTGQDIRYIGGWGLQIGDQASGAWLGRALLTHCILVCDGLRDGSALTTSVLSRFDNSAARITRFAASAKPADYAAFARDIVTASVQDDPVACTLMQDGADYLNRCLSLAGLSDAGAICVTGGLGKHYLPFLTSDARDRVVDPVGSALDGALMLARKADEGTAPA